MDIKAYLKEHSFFNGLEESALDKIIESASTVQLYAGQVLFKGGEPANKFYVVRSGKIALEVEVPGKDNLQVQLITEGEVMGWSWLFPPKEWHFSARAEEFSRAIFFDADKLIEIFEQDPVLGLNFVKRISQVLAERLTFARLQMIKMHSS